MHWKHAEHTIANVLCATLHETNVVVKDIRLEDNDLWSKDYLKYEDNDKDKNLNWSLRNIEDKDFSITTLAYLLTGLYTYMYI